MTAGPTWLDALEADAPDVVACWRALDDTFAGLKRLRRELRRGSAPAAPNGSSLSRR